MCQKDALIIAVAAVFFCFFFSLELFPRTPKQSFLGRFETRTRVFTRWYPYPPPPWSFEIIKLERKFPPGL